MATSCGLRPLWLISLTATSRLQNKTPLVVGYPYRMLHRKDEKRSPYILLPWMHQRYPSLRKLACKQRFYNSFCSTYVCYEGNIGYNPLFCQVKPPASRLKENVVSP